MSLLKWQCNRGYQEALLGVLGDGVEFTLTFQITCYRRGKYKLLVEVRPGPAHHLWGCFDEQDQPTRWFHSRENALDEAELIARALLEDRLKGAKPAWAQFSSSWLGVS